MRKRYNLIVALLIGSHLLTELHTLIMWINPNTTTVYVDWFVKKNAVKDLSILWYFKMMEDLLLMASIMFAGACQARAESYQSYLQWQRYSFRLYSLWLLYFFYHVFDMVMFIYNYKTSYCAYIVSLVTVTITALLIAFYRKKHFFKK